MKPKYKLGRYKNTATGKVVNVWKMRRGSFDVLAYRPQGKPPVIIPESEFYSIGVWMRIDPMPNDFKLSDDSCVARLLPKQET